MVFLVVANKVQRFERCRLTIFCWNIPKKKTCYFGHSKFWYWGSFSNEINRDYNQYHLVMFWLKISTTFFFGKHDFKNPIKNELFPQMLPTSWNIFHSCHYFTKKQPLLDKLSPRTNGGSMDPLSHFLTKLEVILV